MSLHNPRAPRRGAVRPAVRTLLSTAIAIALMPVFALQAQTATPDSSSADQQADATKTAAKKDEATQMSEIVVTGARASLDHALTAKQADDHVVEVIASDNLGQMPNVTVAESLVRLPGVNGARDRGNESLATVRGLGPRMTLGLVNGREIASSEPTRAVRWEIFPTEVVSMVKVYKSQSADLVAGGIGATIDIDTISPLDYSGKSLVGTAGPVYYSEGKDIPGYSPWGNRFGLSWIHKLNENLAVALGATYQKQKNANALMGSWGYTDSTNGKDVTGGSGLTPTPWGAADELKQLEQTRNGAMAAVEWRSGNLDVKFDALYSKIDIKEKQNQTWFNGWAYSIWSSGNPYATPGSSYILADGDVVGGTLANSNLEVDHVIGRYNEIKTLNAYGVNAKWSGDDWTYVGDLSTSGARRDNNWRAVWFGDNPSTVSYDFRDGVTPTISTTSNGLSWGVNGSNAGPESLRDSIDALAVSAKRQLGGSPFTSIEFGARAADREKLHRNHSWSQSGYNQPISAYNGLTYWFPEPDLHVPAMLGGNLDAISQIAFGGWNPSLASELLLDHWNVKEKVREAYTKAAYDSTLFGVAVNGNVGVRVVGTDTSSSGYDSIGSTVTPSHATNSYNDVLPSATMNFMLDDERILRLAAAKVVARPPLDELRTGRSLSDPVTTVGQLTGSGGNPTLDPFRATQLDASYEWYFNKEALAAVSVYRKWVDSSIGYKIDHEKINGYDYLVSGPFNGGGGYINGVELTFQTPFYFIPHLENFGIYSNYSYVQSNLKEFSPTDNPLVLSGLAKSTATIDLWYNTGKFEVRLGYKYHSPYTIIYGWNESALSRLESEGIFDLSSYWQVNDVLSLKLQLGNLTNEKLRAYFDNKPNRLANKDATGGYQAFGRRLALEATVAF
jgi:TonB-dependent receptor